MSDHTDSTLRSIAQRDNLSLSVGRNSLISRGLQDLANFPTAPSAMPTILTDDIHEAARNGDRSSVMRILDMDRASVKVDAELLAATVELTEAAIDDGVSTFLEYVTWIADNIGEAATRTIAHYLEAGWNRLGTYDRFSGKIDKAGKVADVLPAAEPEAGSSEQFRNGRCEE